MSLIEPEEIRYVAISMFGIIIMSTLLDWTGIGSKYQPPQPTSSEIGNVTSVGDRSVLDTIMEPSLTGGLSQTPIDQMIDIVITPIQFPINLLIQWNNVWNSIGWPSMFIIVPMLIMMFILAGAIVKLVSAIIP